MTNRDHTGVARSSLEANYDSALLGRLGRALAYVYDDTVQASLPPALQILVDRLHEAALKDGEEAAGPRTEMPRQ